MDDVIDLRDGRDGKGVVVSEPDQPTHLSAESASGTEGASEPDEAEAVLDLGAPNLAAALEALLLLADEPTPAVVLAEVTGRPETEVEETLAGLAMRYLAEERGIEIRRTDSGWRFYTATACRDLITRYVTDGRQSRLSQAALETLAIIAYRQPASRSQVGAIRGVNPDGVIKTLQARGLIRESTEEGGVTRFVTTDYFLDRMGLDSLGELPPIADHLPELGSLDELID